MKVFNFKLKFSNPVIILEGTKTSMTIIATLNYGKATIKSKKFDKTITLHQKDKYDLNKAKNILQASLEQKAYLWAKKYIDKEIEKEQNILNTLKAFSEKATHIIEHDNGYINKLIL